MGVTFLKASGFTFTSTAVTCVFRGFQLLGIVRASCAYGPIYFQPLVDTDAMSTMTMVTDF